MSFSFFPYQFLLWIIRRVRDTFNSVSGFGYKLGHRLLMFFRLYHGYIVVNGKGWKGRL